MSDTLFFILYPLIASLTLCANLCIISNVSMPKKAFIKYTAYLYIITCIFFNHNQIAFVLISIFSYFYLKKYRINLLSYILDYILVLLIILTCDATGGFIITVIVKMDYNSFLQDKLLYFIIGLIILICSLTLSSIAKKLSKKFNFNYNKIKIDPSIKKVILLVTLVFAIFTFSFRIMVFYFLKNFFTDIVLVYAFCAILILSFSAIIVFFLNKITTMSVKNDFAEKENKQLKEYTDMLEKMSSDLRKFKHDYVNILYTLGDYINDGDIDNLKKYYHEDLLPESKIIVKSDKNITLLKNIKITPLKALISSKLLAAQSEGIEINAEVLEEVNKLSIKTIDICRIIGIFLDNAIEAARVCDKKFVHFAMIKTDDNIIIVILNSCVKNIPPVYQLYQKNFSTKGKNRGIGLTSVKELIDTFYKNILLNTSVQNGVFKQELVIKNCNLE